MKHALVSALALLLVGASLEAQRDRFQDTTTVTVVEVPVQVVADGDPVKGLTADDFEILDGRKKQDIIGFEMVDLTVTEEKATVEIPAAARRHFLALFDLSGDPQAVTRAQKAAADLVAEELHPTDLVAVATYSPSQGPRLVLGFTPDRAQVRLAIDSLGLVELRNRVNDPLGLMLTDSDFAIGESEGPSAGAGGPIDTQSMLAEQMKSLETLTNRVDRDQMANEVMAMTSSMEAIAQMMSAIDGRKHVLLLSEGFDSSLLMGNTGNTEADRQRQLELAQRAQDGQIWDVDHEERFGDTALQSGMRRMLEVFRESDATIQAVDIGGLVAGRANPNSDGLFYMANETGGEMFTNYNDLGSAMGEMLQRTSVTYLLAFQPRDLEYDGKFRPIKVKLKNGPRGARLVHRPGYYPPKPYDQQSPFERRLRTAQQVVGGAEGGAVSVRAIATPIHMPGERPYVPVLVEALGEDLLRNFDDEVMAVELYAYAQDADGHVRDFFVRKLGLDTSQAGDQLRHTGLKYFGHLDLDPGEYTLRVLVRNEATGLSGVAVSSLQVPADGENAVLPPMFPEPVGLWVLAREDAADAREGAPFPYQVGSEVFLPAARPTLKPGQSSEVRLFAYNLGQGSLSATAQLVADGGATVPAEIQLKEAQSAGGMARLTATLDPGRGAKAGPYTLVVTLKDLASGAEETATLPVVVGR